MTIDEAIAQAREFAEKQRKDNENCKYKAEYGCKGCADYYSKPCIECAAENEQLAEWLEELKEYRKHIDLTEIPEQYKLGYQDGITEGYSKAIDDFAEKAKDMFADFDREHGYPTVGDCEDILQDVVEQLKAGDTD